MKRFIAFILISSCFLAAQAPEKPRFATEKDVPNLAQLKQMQARFAPTDLRVDVSKLSPGDRKALAKLIEASRILNQVFMDQYWLGARNMYTKLKHEATTPLGKARLDYFWLNKGPWSDLDDFKAFIPGVLMRKPEGANFYPLDMSKEEFEAWVKTLPDKEKERATGFYTIIKRSIDCCELTESEKPADPHALTIVPYSKAYAYDLKRAADLLKEAAALTDNESLKKFLNLRAEAFLSDDYYASDVAWMDLDAPIDVTIGPYEVYNDEMFGYKAAFESYINLRDDKETQKLSFFSNHLQEIEDNLPEDPQYRVKKLGALSPIRVVNEIIASGDGAHGVQTAAYNLPNDDRVVAEKGSKRVMLKNVQEAKFNKTLVPISRRVLKPEAQKDLSFEWFFTHILAHELTHGLGPHQIEVKGKQTNPRLELKNLYSAIEECKADVTGLFALQYMIDHNEQMHLDQMLDVKDKAAAERKLYTTYLASSFRTLRFGAADAHGKGMVIQMKFVMDRGGFVAHPDGTFSVDYGKVKDAFRDLDHVLLTIEATGDYAGAKKLLDEAVLSPELKKALDKLKDVPTDIAPRFVTADEVAPEGGARPVMKKPVARKKG